MTTIWVPADDDIALRAGATRTEALQSERPYCGPPPTVQMQRVAAEQARI
jgi:hypothetical protein